MALFRLSCASILLALAAFATSHAAEPDATPNSRRPTSEKELRAWLENMVWHHRFDLAEIKAATGMEVGEIDAALSRLDIRPENRPIRQPSDPLRMLPYPGGRHPRIGFLDGAVDPQRETKLSVFTPWNDAHYVVLDVPEAIWWKEGTDRELLYLAHSHVPTTWTKQGIELEKTEWKASNGMWSMSRTLPNGVRFGAKAIARQDSILMEMWLTNGTKEKLTGLQVQACVMLKGAPPFAGQSNDNKVLRQPYVACHDTDSRQWVITAWTECDRVWANPPCPCMHSDPRLPDCPPGETVSVRGWLSFYEGTDIERELARIEATRWPAERMGM